MKEVSTSPLQGRLPPSERKARHAKRMRKYREERPGAIESRTTDRMIVEALTLHLERIDRRSAKAILDAIQPLVVDGLEHRGYDRGEAKTAFDRRIRALLPTDADDDRRQKVGFVRMAAKARSIGRRPGGFFQITP